MWEIDIEIDREMVDSIGWYINAYIHTYIHTHRQTDRQTYLFYYLKVQSCKLCNKYIIASTFIAVLVFKLLNHKVFSPPLKAAV